MDANALLGPNDPSPVRIIRPGGQSPFLLLCDHAGRAVPQALGDLGVGAGDWDRHIAWDIGILGVCERLAVLLDAMCIAQAYSRLVIDCNRPPGHTTSIVTVSDGTAVPANTGLADADVSGREKAIFTPYHHAITHEIDRRMAAKNPPAIIAMHSFTPVFGGLGRPWHAGVLHHRTPALSLALARAMTARGLLVGDNEPYRLSDESDYTVPVHAERRGLAYVELEIRQDQIGQEAGQAEWAEMLAELLPQAMAAISGTDLNV